MKIKHIDEYTRQVTLYGQGPTFPEARFSLEASILGALEELSIDALPDNPTMSYDLNAKFQGQPIIGKGTTYENALEDFMDSYKQGGITEPIKNISIDTTITAIYTLKDNPDTPISTETQARKSPSAGGYLPPIKDTEYTSI